MNKLFKGVMSLCVMFTAVVMVGCGKDPDTKPEPKPNKEEVTFEVMSLEYPK